MSLSATPSSMDGTPVTAPSARGVPSVTVIVPCFNHGRFVADAVRSALAQPGADVRVVVVDDGSTDGTTPRQCDACLDLPGAAGRVHVLHQANTGLPGARNNGAAAALRLGWESQYLLPLDADDYLEPTGLSDLLSAMEDEQRAGRDGDVSHVYGQQRLAELGQGVWAVPEWDPLLLMITNLHPPTALIRRDRFEEVGGYTASMTLGYEDWDLWIKFAARGWRGVRVRKPVYVWRRHSTETMIMNAVRHHDRIYADIVARHGEFYRRHADALLVLANTLLRRSDANWLDENLEAIPIRDMRAWIRDLIRERDEARAELTRARAEVADLESKPVVRISRAVHDLLDRLPRPLAAPARGLLRTVKKAAPPARG